MAKTLVLAEKPSVGRELARVLGCKRGGEGYLEGERYVVTWALGHLVTLADPDVYEKKWEKWDMEDLPMLPQNMKLVVIPQTGRQFRVVQGLMKRGDISELVIATDAGREGELVARWIMAKAGWKKPTKRLWISSQTDRAIKEGFARLRPAGEYDNLFRSAQARSEADWLVGLNVTRALTCRHNAQLSAGRVQTPTLALIVQREREIRNFVPKDYWGVRLKVGGFSAVWRDKNNNSRTFDKALAEKVAAACQNGEAVLTQVRKMRRMSPPPAAYDLTELQRDANKKFAYSAKETLNLMQSLYEQHKLLTYPRTDSRYISDDVVPTLPERLKAVMVDAYKPFAQEIMRSRPLKTKYLVNNAKVTDHHAIIPTEESPDLWQLTGQERNIYDLVVRRFLAVLMPPQEYEEVELTLTVAGHTFTAKGKIIQTMGWRAVYDRSFSMDEDEEDTQSLPPVTQGQRIKVSTVQVTAGKTPPPPRYTEATLLTAMEHPQTQVEDKNLRKILEETSGLGTPATRADIIEKLFSAFYIERRGKELVPTSKGMQLVELAPADLRSAALTAQWEDRLARIAKGLERDTKFVEEMRAYATKLVAAVKASDAKYTHDNQTRKTCPDCGKFLLLVKGKRGEMLVCPDRECGYREKLSAFKERREKAGAGKRDVAKFMQNQKEDKPVNTGMADQLAKWLESQKK